jgi:DinB superfamily
MVLTKEELIASLQHEVRVLLHLASKVDPAKLDYRPSPKQRSLLELLQYLTIMGPIYLRTIKAGGVDMDSWRNTWRTEEATAKALNLEQVKDAIGKQSALFADLLDSCSDADFRTEIEMFGNKASRGSWLVWMGMCHYAAYRMQLFLYLKACGREELSTMNLWAGRDSTA